MATSKDVVGFFGTTGVLVPTNRGHHNHAIAQLVLRWTFDIDDPSHTIGPEHRAKDDAL